MDPIKKYISFPVALIWPDTEEPGWGKILIFYMLMLLLLITVVTTEWR